MVQDDIINNLNYYRARKSADIMLRLGLITHDEYDRFMTLNVEKFSPLYADLFPKTVDISSIKR